MAEDMGVTANAILLAGYIHGSLGQYPQPVYLVVECMPADGAIVVEHAATGNTYRVAVVQLTGTE